MVASEFVSELRQRYGIEFHDLSLLDEAFTHSSYVNEHKEWLKLYLPARTALVLKKN